MIHAILGRVFVADVNCSIGRISQVLMQRVDQTMANLVFLYNEFLSNLSFLCVEL